MRNILWPIVLGAAVPAGLAVPGSLRGADEPFIGPYIQDLRHDSVVILWETEELAVGEVEVGESETTLLAFNEGEPWPLHAVEVTGLETDTRYVYRVRWGTRTSGFHSFRTLPPLGTRKFRLAAYGDSRSNPAVHSAVVARVLELDPDIVIHTGDLVSDGTKKEHWKPQFFDPLRPLASRTPIVTSMGNHENDSSLYYQYFHRPQGQGWFAYRWANVHFIVLDSQKPYAPGSEQYQWLEEELRGPRPDWRIVYCHHAMFSCHPTRPINENRWAWQDLFDRQGVDLVLTGHDHYYHRSHRVGRALDPKSRGVYHITTAGGGASLYPVEDKVYSAMAQSIHHFIAFEIDGKSLTGRVIGVDGSLIDSFTIDRTGREQTPFVSYEMILWEKALREAIEKLPPEPVQGLDGRIERRLRLPPFPGGAATVACRWVGGSGFWASGACEGLVEAGAKAPFEVLIWGEGPVRAMYPLPRLELTPLRGPVAWRDYVNRSVVLEPLRFTTNQALHLDRLAGTVKVDGKLDEPCWRNAVEASGFTRDFARLLSGRETFLLGYDDGGIVVGARVRSFLDKPLEKGAKERDTRHMYRTDESVSLVISPPSLIGTTFFFCGNSRGARFDSLHNTRFEFLSSRPEWNPEWELATSEVADGWCAEVRIPWIVLGLEGPPRYEWRINLLRWDATDKMLSEWAPTFSLVATSRKHDARLTFEVEGVGGK